MPSQLKQLRLSRKTGNFGLVDNSLKRKIRRKNSRKGSISPSDEDIERIIEDYMDDDFKLSIINRETSRMALESLERGDALSGNSEDFVNFISGAGKGKMVDFLFEKFAQENILNLLSQELELKTKTIKGFAFNDEIYIRETKAGLRAYRFKDNRFAKIPKNLFR